MGECTNCNNRFTRKEVMYAFSNKNKLECQNCKSAQYISQETLMAINAGYLDLWLAMLFPSFVLMSDKP